MRKLIYLKKRRRSAGGEWIVEHSPIILAREEKAPPPPPRDGGRVLTVNQMYGGCMSVVQPEILIMVQPKTAVEWQSVPGSILCGSWTKDRAHYWTRDHIHSSFQLLLSPAHSGIGSTPRTVVQASSRWPGEDVTVYVWHKPAELALSFLFYSCVFFCLYGPFNCISFRKLSRQLSVFLTPFFRSYLLPYWSFQLMYRFMKVSFSPGKIPSGWLGLKTPIN